MNTTKEHLTKAEAEALCQAYLDCRLSLQEELELEYVLARSDLHSELIDDVRGMMIASRSFADTPSVQLTQRSPRRSRRWLLYSAAACVAVVLSVGISLINHQGESAEPEYIAYISGKQLRGEEAKRACLAELAQYNQMMNEVQLEMAEVQRRMQGVNFIKDSAK